MDCSAPKSAFITGKILANVSCIPHANISHVKVQRGEVRNTSTAAVGQDLNLPSPLAMQMHGSLWILSSVFYTVPWPIHLGHTTAPYIMIGLTIIVYIQCRIFRWHTNVLTATLLHTMRVGLAFPTVTLKHLFHTSPLCSINPRYFTSNFHSIPTPCSLIVLRQDGFVVLCGSTVKGQSCLCRIYP